ncbi:probable peroxygenase 5 isoform X2 [Vigna radiata var. radiata]|uniref:Probable peroxygenase 5 isoform X2 n=1 Tax=Vigna radiata var. radiata TaxID=3916 RepID=A0A1S3VLN6_VIGRR|nr:probable peroxygenase 5 isoform X2 [Vigna radiata var. radiata]
MQPLTYIYIHLISSLNHYYTYLLYFLIPKKTFIFLLNLCHMASSPPSLNQKQEGMLGEKSISLEENVLQKHAAFFDINKDGVIYPWETFQGMREIGSGILLSIGGAIFINVFLSQTTRPGKFPSLLFPIEVENIQRGKHGSDSGVYDTQGRFVPPKFEAIFSKHAHTNPNYLTYDELKEMIKANREPKDLKGRIGSFVEWSILYKLAKDKNGLLQKDTIRGVYDGSLFEQLKNQHSSAKKK